MELQELSNYIMRKKDIKIAENEIYAVSRKVVRFYISLIKRTRGTDYYRRYAHTIVRLVETAFKKQNSSVNEMVQHGISIYKGFDMENKTLETFAGGRINWINELMSKCGVISSEQPVQEHTRIVTDAKKREYPFHKMDRIESRKPVLFRRITRQSISDTWTCVPIRLSLHTVCRVSLPIWTRTTIVAKW